MHNIEDIIANAQSAVATALRAAYDAGRHQQTVEMREKFVAFFEGVIAPLVPAAPAAAEAPAAAAEPVVEPAAEAAAEPAPTEPAAEPAPTEAEAAPEAPAEAPAEPASAA